MWPSLISTLMTFPLLWSPESANHSSRQTRVVGDCSGITAHRVSCPRTSRIGGLMIVRDAGDKWQVVLQTDHADLSGEIARRWKERTTRSDSLAIAAERHDDGWAVWEQSPMCDSTSSIPLNFLDVGVLA